MADISELAAGIIAGDRNALAKGITLVESTKPADRGPAERLIDAVLPRTGHAMRVGITGVPGVGKSTFIDALGIQLTASGKRVAVLAVDPSSSISGGSILGDKSRMHRLARDQAAFIRPSPSAGTLGGVARRTRETLLLCEAAGYDVVIVETVGVGQSETVVADMVDTFLLLALPGAGDELQGIKRGVVELADVVAVNKADGDNKPRAAIAVRELQAALRYLRPKHEDWQPTVRPISATEGAGLSELWDDVLAHRRTIDEAGGLATLRADQTVRWMWSEIEEGLRSALQASEQARELLAALEAEVRAGTTTPSAAAARVLATFLS